MGGPTWPRHARVNVAQRRPNKRARHQSILKTCNGVESGHLSETVKQRAVCAEIREIALLIRRDEPRDY